MLDLRWNDIGTRGTATISSSIRRSSSVRLILYLNSQGATELQEALSMNLTLTELRLEGNGVIFEVTEALEVLTRKNAAKVLLQI